MAEHLRQWDFSNGGFQVGEISALILGIDPTTIQDDQRARTAPVNQRLSNAYWHAVGFALNTFHRKRVVERTDFSGGFFLPSWNLFDSDLLAEVASIDDPENHPDLALDKQIFRREDIQDWLDAHKLTSTYTFHRRSESPPTASPVEVAGSVEITSRERKTLLNIVGALLDLMLEKGPSGKTRSGYKDEAAIKEQILIRFAGTSGLSESNLNRKFPDAKKSLTESQAAPR